MAYKIFFWKHLFNGLMNNSIDFVLHKMVEFPWKYTFYWKSSKNASFYSYKFTQVFVVGRSNWANRLSQFAFSELYTRPLSTF